MPDKYFEAIIMNILLSFAQLEQELIGERTRDKMSAARREGKWAGGCPVLGYDVDPGGGRLVVNENEAERVRAIFAPFEKRGSVPLGRNVGAYSSTQAIVVGFGRKWQSFEETGQPIKAITI